MSLVASDVLTCQALTVGCLSQYYYAAAAQKEQVDTEKSQALSHNQTLHRSECQRPAEQLCDQSQLPATQ